MLKRIANRLRKIEPAEFRRMETAAANVTRDLLSTFHSNFEVALRSIDSLMARPSWSSPLWRGDVHRVAHDLRGLGGTFNYGLITIIGDSLCALIRLDDLPKNRRAQRHIAAHVAALRAILQFDLTGDGGSQGQELLATLKIEDDRRRPH